MIRENKLAIVSIAKNIEFSFSRDFEIVTNAFADFKVLKWVIVESNSTDNSMEVLQKYSSEHSFLHHRDLGLSTLLVLEMNTLIF